MIENGRILEKNLLRNYLCIDHLMALLRGKGIFNPSNGSSPSSRQTGPSAYCPGRRFGPSSHMGPEEVFYAEIDTQGNLYSDGFDDRITDSRVQVREMGPH